MTKLPQPDVRQTTPLPGWPDVRENRRPKDPEKPQPTALPTQTPEPTRVPTLAPTATQGPTPTPSLPSPLAKLEHGAWLGANEPDLATELRRLPSVADGVDEKEREAADAFPTTGQRTVAAALRVMGRSNQSDCVRYCRGRTKNSYRESAATAVSSSARRYSRKFSRVSGR